MTKSQLNRTPPYSGTDVDAETSKAQINKLLDDYGVIGKSWQEYKGEEVLQFIVEAEIQNTRKEIGIEVRPPVMMRRRRIYNKSRTKYKTAMARDKNQEYRLLYWWLKAKLEAVVYGLISIEREFLSHVIISGELGRTTVGEAIEGYIVNDQLKALPAPQYGERKAVEAEYREVP